MEKIISTTEVPLAATLLWNGVELIRATRDDSGTVSFLFEDVDTAQAVFLTYANGSSRVEPKGFDAAVKKILAVLRATAREEMTR